MDSNEKRRIEEFAHSALGARAQASIYTGELQKRGLDIQELTAAISDYNRLPPEERAYNFEKDYGSCHDEQRFYIAISRRE